MLEQLVNDAMTGNDSSSRLATWLGVHNALNHAWDVGARTPTAVVRSMLDHMQQTQGRPSYRLLVDYFTLSRWGGIELMRMTTSIGFPTGFDDQIIAELISWHDLMGGSTSSSR